MHHLHYTIFIAFLPQPLFSRRIVILLIPIYNLHQYYYLMLKYNELSTVFLSFAINRDTYNNELFVKDFDDASDDRESFIDP